MAPMFVGFSYTRARFQYAAARQEKAQTRERKIMKKTMFVRREQIRKMRQTRPGRIIGSAILHGLAMVKGAEESVGDEPMKRRKKAKLALKAGCCNPSGFPGFPIWAAACSGFVT